MSRSICVFCASSKRVDGVYRDAIEDLARRMAERGDVLVYGGTNVGLMGVLAETMRLAGGRVVGIIPRFMVDHGIADEACDELLTVDDMRVRKTLMEQRADAFITMPGGFGTLEEFYELLALKQLDQHRKPIVLVNTLGFYDALLGFHEQLYAQQFARTAYRDNFAVVADPGEALSYLDNYTPTSTASKWR